MDTEKKEWRALLMSPWLWLLASGAILVIIVVNALQTSHSRAPELTYTAFLAYLDEGRVTRVTTVGHRLEFNLKTKDETGPPSQFATTVPEFGDGTLMTALRTHKVEVVSEAPQSGLASALWGLLFYALPIGLILLLLSNSRQPNNDLMKFSRSGVQSYKRSSQYTTFSDVAGAEGAKRELLEVVEFLRDPGQFERLGGRIPRGVLLIGPPGTGKTLLARAVAGEAQASFFFISGSQFIELFVGVGAARVRDLFAQAKVSSPAIIFIDELDSIGRRRGSTVALGNDEREQTLNQILTEMDGFDRNHNVIVLAATNRPDILDPALLRPGRFDRHVMVELPTLADRLAILKVHTLGKPLAPDLDLTRVAQNTPGFSGADLANLLNEAAILAARHKKSWIEESDIDQAYDKVAIGLEHESLRLSEDERRLVAYHEAGHALAAFLLPEADPVHKVSIIPRGRGLGITQQAESERHIYRREYIQNRLAIMMGGRAAEALIFGSMTTGAENDLKEATKLARRMVLDWGMAESLPHMALSDTNTTYTGETYGETRPYSETTAQQIDQAVQCLLRQAYQWAYELLQHQQAALHRLATQLLERETLTGREVAECVGAMTMAMADEAVG